jgi:hypothetical protein
MNFLIFFCSFFKAEDDTLESLKLLSELDKVKLRFESVCNGLKEAEKLNKLSESIEVLFQTKNFGKVTNRGFSPKLKKKPKPWQISEELSQMDQRYRSLLYIALVYSLQESLSALKGVPEFDKNRKNLENLQVYLNYHKLLSLLAQNSLT